nr:endonuclease/exonuclease/phosphatase family protein [Lysinibacter cavernae]
MTLNLHQGLDANTHVNLGGLVDLVRTQDPDILAVQEVNRGRANNGYNDVLAVLAAELDLPFLYGTNSPDGLYGNALLSRLPVTDWEYHHFDASSGERRGMLEATLSVAGTAEGPSTDLTVLVTHLDHVSGDDNVRGAQLDELNAIWDGRAPAILLGDFNTTPESPELAALGERGWTDALAQYGDPTATTFWGAPGGSEPESRLDYVFVTPGITVERVASVDSKASDHKPIVARVSVR